MDDGRVPAGVRGRCGPGRGRRAVGPGACRRRPMSGERMYRRGFRFLRARWRVVVRLAAWSVLESGQTFLTGFALARALDAGFLAGRAAVGLGWLGAAAVAVIAGAYGTGRVYAAVAALVEPLRDRLVRDVVDRGVRDAD
ncbi:ABC transporter ATP-binding protein, partial [Streptomyces sp. NPDC057757]